MKEENKTIDWKEPVVKKKKRSAAYSKNKGSAYERQIVNELKELTGNDAIATSRSASKALDNMKIDIYDGDNVLPCYFQLKKTQTTPSIKKINADVGLTDKPLCILWNIQVKKEGNTNITSGGEYAMLPKDLFYKMLRNYISESPINADNSNVVKLSKEDEILAKTIEYYNELKTNN